MALTAPGGRVVPPQPDSQDGATLCATAARGSPRILSCGNSLSWRWRRAARGDPQWHARWAHVCASGGGGLCPPPAAAPTGARGFPEAIGRAQPVARVAGRAGSARRYPRRVPLSDASRVTRGGRVCPRPAVPPRRFRGLFWGHRPCGTRVPSWPSCRKLRSPPNGQAWAVAVSNRGGMPRKHCRPSRALPDGLARRLPQMVQC